MQRTLITVVISVVLVAHQTWAQDCAMTLCQNGENCYTRNSAEGYVCECNLPFRDGHDCAIGPDNQEVFTCYGPSCTSGVFQSSNYPLAYPNRYRALYLLYIPGANGIMFTFDEVFAIETDKDELYVGKGLSVDFNALNNVDTADKRFFEGFVRPDSFTLDNTDAVWMYFSSDKNLEYSGFSIRFQMVDDTPPTITNCPQSFTRTAPFGATSIPVIWTEPTATDNSGTPTRVLRSPEPGSFFTVGQTTPVLYRWIDAYGNNADCTFDVTVIALIDDTPPTITNCPQSFTRTAPFGATSIPVTWTEPTATDNSGTPTRVLRSPEPGSFFTVGQTTPVLYRWIDAYGNNADCTFDVTVIALIDDTPPTITNCPQSFTRTAPFGATSIPVTWTEPTATDNSGTPTRVLRSPEPGSFFTVGQTTPVLYRWIDAYGNNADCTFDVTVIALNDNTFPVVTFCPEPIIMFVPFMSPGITATWDPPMATDNSGSVTTSQTHVLGAFFATGSSTTVTYTFRDAAGNEVMCQFNIRIFQQSDSTPPVIISCPSDQVQFVPFLTSGLQVSWSDPVVSDNSGNFDTFQTHTSGSFFLVGGTPVEYTFRDAGNNEVMCSFTVTVIQQVDNERPVIVVCPANEALTVPFQSSGTSVIWNEPTVTDNSGAFNTQQTQNSGDFIAANTQTEVRYTFTDAAGNEAICIFTITVLEEGDNLPPVVTACPNDITVFVPFQSTGIPVSWAEPTAIDNSGTFDTTQTRILGSFFLVGEERVTYVFRDAANNENECSFVVRVIERGDTEPPMVSCLENRALEVPFQSTGTRVSWNEPTVTDNSGTFSTTQTHNSGDFFAVNTQTDVQYTFTDAAGLVGICVFTVTVTEMGDSIPPLVTSCPMNQVQFVPFLTSGLEVRWSDPVVFDNSGNFNTVQTHTSGSFFLVGGTPVEYTFRDAANNEVMCSFTVTVIQRSDSESPMTVVCPESMTVTVPFQVTGTSVSWNEPTITDNSGAFTTEQTHNSGDFFVTNSQTPVRYTFTDAAGNEAFCDFTVTVFEEGDNLPPVVTFCPNGVTEFVPFLSTGIPVSWTEPTAIDNSGTFDMTKTHNVGSFFTVGEERVTYVFRDAANNENECSFVVRVIELGDATPPDVISCPDSVAVNVPFQTQGTAITWTEPTVVDNSGTFSTTQTHNSGDFFAANTQTEVEYKFTDAAGNEGFCMFTVTVAELGDMTPPVITSCPTDISEFVPFQLSGTTVIWDDPIVSDNSGSLETTQTRASGSFFITGSVTTVMYTFTDMALNEVRCSFNVVVIELGDVDDPVVAFCPADISISVPFQNPGTNAAWDEPVVTDNSGTFTTTQTHNSGDFFNANTQTQVVYSFIDAARNPAFCRFTVTVMELADNIPPMVNCPPGINEIVQFGAGGAFITWALPTVTDNSGSFSPVETTHNPNTFLPTGQTTVTYRYRDSAGNENTCSFAVNIVEVDTIPPVIQTCPSNILEQVQFGVTGKIVTWSEPTATDNTGQQVFISQRSVEPGTFFPVGQTEVVYTLMDPSGNEVRCLFTVTVIAVDTLNPMVQNCPVDITLTILTGTGPVPIQYATPSATDNTGIVNLVFQSHSPGDLFAAGQTGVTLRFEDEAGNFANCMFTVTINEANPCLSQPCQNGAACIAETLTSYRCLCSECFTGDRCEQAVDVCGNGNTCQNGAFCTALPGSCTQYVCNCLDCFIGQFCQGNVDSCENNQCANGAVCISSAESCLEYTCRCPPCYAGRFCNIPISACANPDCANGGVCLPAINPNNIYSCSEYTCSCNGCFTGEKCEIQRNACNPNPCLNGAECSSLPDSCYSYTCRCNGCFTGFNCEIPIGSPCEQNPCQNGGVCNVIQGTCSSYACSCPNTHIGVDCELAVTVNPNPCNSFPCLNGASCLTMDGTHYICLCPPSSVGENCQSTIASLPAMNRCATNPCRNGAMCYNSYSSNAANILIPQYTCKCDNGFTGANCASTIADNPALDICSLPDKPNCEQGASCSNAFHSFDNDVDYICNCPIGFIGHNCETLSTNPCTSNPCKNGAQCQPFNTYYTCQCPVGYIGLSCEISVGDNIDPVINNCPESITRNIAAGSNNVVTWTAPTATDNSGAAFLIYTSHTPGFNFPVGIATPITYVFSDPSMNYAICTFFVTVTNNVVDNTPPVISNCPANRVVTAASAATSAVVTWFEPTATDNSGLAVSRVSNASPGSSFNLGSTLVTYTFTDNSGIEARCEFTVAVIPGTTDDNTPPVIRNCPTNRVVTAASGATSAVVTWFEPTATDNSGLAVNRVSNASPGNSFNLGSTLVTYTFTDNSGNEARCLFSITVNSGTVADNVPPMISNCPMSAAGTLAQGALTVVVTWTVPTATDESGGIVTRTSTHNSGDSFGIGNTLVTYTFTDPSGNNARCELVVMVTTIDSGDNPVIFGCPVSQTVRPDAFSGSANVSWVEPTAVDSSGQEANVAKSHTPPDTFEVNTVTRITYIFYDNLGRFETCSFQITVTGGTVADNVPPMISNCPMSAAGTLAQGATTVVVTWTVPTATDESGGIVTRTSTHNSGDSFGIGNTLVTYTFTDPSGNDARCELVVMVTTIDSGDNPVIFGCPVSQTVRPDAFSGSANVSWVEPTAVDSSGQEANVAKSHTPPDTFEVNTVTRITYIFYDNLGRFETCSFQITVTGTTDNTPPVISNCPTNQVVTAAPGATSAVVTWIEPTATDNSRLAVNRVSNVSPGNPFNLGSTVVTYTFTDNSGIEARCEFTVEVIPGVVGDNTPPVISNCPVGVSAMLAQGAATVAAAWMVPTAADNSGGIVIRTSTHNPGDRFTFGNTPVTYTFTDPSGNDARCQFIVKVSSSTATDNEPPVITGCPTPVTVSPDAGLNTANVSWVEPTATDNSGRVPSVSSSHTPPATFSVNTVTSVAYIFYDSSANFDRCDFIVTVTDGGDRMPPVISGCPNGITTTGPNNALVSWVEPTATDNDGQSVSVSRSRSPNSVFSAGPTTVLYTFTDTSGNDAFCSFVVTVSGDQTPPIISNCPSNIQVAADTNVPTITVTWTEPTATDNSGLTVSRVSTASPGDSFNVGIITTVTYTFTDNSGNEAQCSFTVNITATTYSNPCDSNPCPADENCYYFQREFLCLANTRRRRDAEETIPVDCKCENGGVCVGDKHSGITCICQEGYQGMLCQQALGTNGVCKPNPCANNGTCVESLVTINEPAYKCICTHDWEGYQCKQANSMADTRRDLVPRPEWNSLIQLILGVSMAVLGTVVIILAATICRLAPRRFTGNRKFHIDEVTLVR